VQQCELRRLGVICSHIRACCESLPLHIRARAQCGNEAVTMRRRRRCAEMQLQLLWHQCEHVAKQPIVSTARRRNV
jgi:hypothetical protein